MSEEIDEIKSVCGHFRMIMRFQIRFIINNSNKIKIL